MKPRAAGGVPVAVPFEITTRWGDTLLDVSHAEGSFALCDVALIAEGALVAPASGRVGLVDYEIATVALPARELPPAHTDDRRVVPYIAAALAVHLGVWAAAKQEPAPHAMTKPRLRATPIHAVDRARAELPDAVTQDRAHDTKGDGRAAASRGSEGRAGTTAALADTGHVAVTNTGEEPQLSKTAAIERARRAGILGDTRLLREQFRTLGGVDQLTSGFDDRQNVTAAFDAADAAARGTFGTGRSGDGIGGGGTRTFGTGDHGGSYSIGTSLGHAWGGSAEHPQTPWSTTWSGRYDGGGYYPHRMGTSSVPTVAICAAPYGQRCRVAGDLDPAIVRRYVKRNIQRLSYCFEKQLLAKPDLAGPLLVEFSVTNGHVEDATASGLDPTVASCVRDVVAQIEFPAAGATRIEYVLVFKPVG